MSVTIRIFQKKKPLKNGLHPIFLRITISRRKKIFSLGLSCSKEDWNEARGVFKTKHKGHAVRNSLLSNYKNKAFSIIDRHALEERELTFDSFKREFKGEEKKVKQNVYDYWNTWIEELKAEGRTGYARSHRDAHRVFFKFTGKRNLKFEDITVKVLENFERHSKAKGNENGGIAARMRNIRAVFNKAIREKLVRQDYYPFREYRISKLKASSTKRALTNQDIKKIENLDLSLHKNLINFRNYFIFSYHTRGMNFADMLLLKWTNVVNGRIYYTRAKTNGNFSIKIFPPVQKILDYYELNSIDTEYIFPILLKDNLTPIQIEYRKNKVLKQYNKGLKEIAKLVGIQQNLTTYVARHSFATNMKQAGISTDIISESLGHSSKEVTEKYLKEFEDEVLDSASALLL